jgi:hypothetical protein
MDRPVSKLTRVLAFLVVRTRTAAAHAWQAAMTDQDDKYRPEEHYMRGPGPKWRAKQGQVSVQR